MSDAGAIASPGAGLDPRLSAYRPDLADARLRGIVNAERYVEGRQAQVIIGQAAVRRRPEPQAETVTFYHHGEAVLVFEEAAGWAWCQSLFDGYVGYVRADRLADGAPPPTHFVATLGSYCYAEPDMRSPPRGFLPRHSAVVAAESGIVTRDRTYVRLDTGVFVPGPCLSRSPPRSTDIVAAAELYLGAPYLWGGRSFLGIDCSGLVQAAFLDLGIVVPRDADMQRATIGAETEAKTVHQLSRGELIYVSGHVLIAIGDDSAIHADGTNMIVRKQRVSEFLAERRLHLSEATLRRDPRGAGDRLMQRGSEI